MKKIIQEIPNKVNKHYKRKNSLNIGKNKKNFNEIIENFNESISLSHTIDLNEISSDSNSFVFFGKLNEILEKEEDNLLQISSEFLPDRALYKEVEINLKIKENHNYLNYIMKKLSEYFDINFIFYEYSNSKHFSNYKISEGDELILRTYCKEIDEKINIFLDSKIHIKILDRLNVLNDLFKTYNIKQSYFYIFTPNMDFSFNYKKNIPLVFSNSDKLKKKLKQKSINIKIIANKLINEIKIENSDGIKKEPILGVEKLFVGNVFNHIINDNILKPLNIFSIFQFEGSIYRKCKKQVIITDNNVIYIKIRGVIFDEQIHNMVIYFLKFFDDADFSVKLNKFRKTTNFYLENELITNAYSLFEYRNKLFHYYK